MHLNNFKMKGTWREVADSARTTIGLEEGTMAVADSWKKHILLAEHSPIRQLTYKWKWYDLPYWVSVHFVRHWLGILHWVKTSRSDRTGIDRDTITQDNPVNHECEANAQAIINISRKRLCLKASSETRAAWILMLHALKKEDPVLASVCVPECIYRGFCPEFNGCGCIDTPEAQERLAEYRGIK